MPKTDNTRVIAEIKAKTDCGDLYRESFPHLCQGNGTNYRCVWHDDQNPSLQPFPDHLFCHAEGKRYDVFDVMKHANDCSFKKAKALLAERCVIAPPTVV